MKRLLWGIAAACWLGGAVQAAQPTERRGRIVDEKGEAVAFATVVVQRDGAEAVGTTTDAEGRFTIEAAAGDCTLSVAHLGMEPLQKELRLDQRSDLGDFTLRNAATAIDEVVVRASLVRREADRFVVDVANAPSAIGKDGAELLEHAPGVWIDGERITINGKTGTKVYVDERELRMEPEQLVGYLRSLRAEEIRKIEVIPVAGADYDADASGGIIRILLKKRRERGTEGSASVVLRGGELFRTVSPELNVNHHSGRFDLYARGWATMQHTAFESAERTDYASSEARIDARSEKQERQRSLGIRAGGLWQAAPRHSIGLEAEYWHDRGRGPTDSRTDFTTGGSPLRTESRYDNRTARGNASATFNYIATLDTLGSKFKVLADWSRRTSSTDDDNRSRTERLLPEAEEPAQAGSLPPKTDSLYRDRSEAVYNILSATLALEKVLSSAVTLRAGAKYTSNDMRNDARYEYLKREEWLVNDRESFRLDYREHIAALYGAATLRLGRWNIAAGLRGEYTATRGKADGVKQRYLTLFPNANVSWSMTPEGDYSIIAQYARTIDRPRFWALNPQRIQISEYTYQTGNPALDPSLRQDVSLTLVLAGKYTLTGGTVIQSGEIQQTIQADGEDPDLLHVAWVNFETTRSHYLTASVPLQIARWWSVNLNATYLRRGERTDVGAPERHRDFGFAGLSTAFTLPAGFGIDLSYRYQSPMEFGNCRVGAMHFSRAGLKKRFGERFTASLSVENPVECLQRIGARGEGFVRSVDIRQEWNSRSYRLSLSYNFRTGKVFRSRSVEAGAAEERSRMN